MLVFPLFLIGMALFTLSWVELILLSIMFFLILLELKNRYRPSREDKEAKELEKKLNEEADRLLRKHGFDPDKVELYRTTCRSYATLKLLDEVNERLKKVEEKLGESKRGDSAGKKSGS